MFASTLDVTRPSIDQAARKIHQVSTLPHVAMRVVEVANDQRSGARELKEVMENDPALSTRVLQYVNSSAYATRTRITNLQQAIAYLGLKQIRNLAMTATVSKLFQNEEQIGPYRRRGLWEHLVSVGLCARLIGMRLKMASFEDIFLAGLLHDIGIVFMDQHVHEGFVAVMDQVAEGKTLSQVEVQVCGFDHAALGAKLAESWRFPEIVAAVIRFHHNSAAYRGADIGTVRCVEVANFICATKGISSMGLNLLAFPKAALVELSLTKDDLLVLVQDLDKEIQQNRMLFQG